MSGKDKISKLRFNIQDDLTLLREVLGCNPFEKYNEWRTIHQNVTKATEKDFSLRTVREHTEHLIKLFKKNDRTNLRKSGTEEEYNEKEQLLQQVVDLEREFGKNGKQKTENKSNSCKFSSCKQTATLSSCKQRAKLSCCSSVSQKTKGPSCSSKSLAIKERDLAAASHFTRYDVSDSEGEEVIETEAVPEQELQNFNLERETQNGEAEQAEQAEQVPLDEELNQPTVEPAPIQNVLRRPQRTSKNKPLKNNALQYLRDKKEAELEIKRRELDIEERKISLDQRKITLEEQKLAFEMAKYESDKEERAKRLKLEVDERSHKILLERQLAEINSTLVQHLLNK